MHGLVLARTTDAPLAASGSDSNRQALKLLMSRPDMEIMRQTVENRDTIWLAAADDESTVEFFCVLSGRLELNLAEGKTLLTPGDCFYVDALQSDLTLRALETTQILYITNKPMFHTLDSFNAHMIHLLEQINEKDNVTLSHSKNVLRYTESLYNHLKLTNQVLSFDTLATAALFHDVGKSRTPDSILKKKGRLTAEEYRTIQEHPGDSAEILLPLFGEQIARIARSHHERLDGSGYPEGLAGQRICLGARIVAVADAFDAMTSVRPYNRVKSPQEALDELLSLPHQYEPFIVQALRELLEQGLHIGADAESTTEHI